MKFSPPILYPFWVLLERTAGAGAHARAVRFAAMAEEVVLLQV